MKVTRLRIIGFIISLIAMPITLIAFSPVVVQAYTCTSSTNGKQHVYKDGACYFNNERQQNEKPVHNDGTAVAEWTCASGKYNETKHACETCGSFGGCTVNSSIPTPKGKDTTVAEDETTNGTTSNSTNNDSKITDKNKGGEGECAGIKTDYFACEGDGAEAASGLLQQIMLIMSVGVGVVAVGGIVYGAILYATARDSQEQVRKSIRVIRAVAIGILLYIFMVAIINWLVPGGVFTSPEPEKQTNGGNATTTGSGSNSGTTGNNSGNNANSATGNNTGNTNGSNNSGN